MWTVSSGRTCTLYGRGHGAEENLSYDPFSVFKLLRKFRQSTVQGKSRLVPMTILLPLIANRQGVLAAARKQLGAKSSAKQCCTYLTVNNFFLQFVEGTSALFVNKNISFLNFWAGCTVRLPKINVYSLSLSLSIFFKFGHIWVTNGHFLGNCFLT